MRSTVTTVLGAFGIILGVVAVDQLMCSVYTPLETPERPMPKPNPKPVQRSVDAYKIFDRVAEINIPTVQVELPKTFQKSLPGRIGVQQWLKHLTLEHPVTLLVCSTTGRKVVVLNTESQLAAIVEYGTNKVAFFSTTYPGPPILRYYQDIRKLVHHPKYLGL